ncbi:MAG: DUF2723 domain-containing protein [Paraprevotella sp.]|nr:DUF2723 domain-containing protein [Paraprevotella sp.]
MLRYQTLDRLCGWTCFLISSVVYICTVEPSTSFWDCPEFILCAARLEVGHPPGAPFFMLLGNLFSHFAASPAQIAYCINIMNALLSGGCILFLFWSITHLVRKLWEPVAEGRQSFVVMGCGFTGALTYAFSDTCWFSAVEGEVYAFSSFLTAVTFWIILRWEDDADNPRSGRWLVLLAYVIGLSVGVHLLNLLCIPSVALVMYYRRRGHAGLKGILFTLLLSFIVIAVVLYGIVPGIMKMAGYFELMAVNGMGLPYYTGMSCYILLLAVVLGWCVLESCAACRPGRMCAVLGSGLLLLGITLQRGVWITLLLSVSVVAVCYVLYRCLRKNNMPSLWPGLHTLAFCMVMLVTGYSSYALIPIRSAANPPMDQQSPEDPFSLRDYLGREQYGVAPLLYGQTFASPRVRSAGDGYTVYESEEGEPVYRQAGSKENGGRPRYIVCGHRWEPVYQPETCVWFPRMYSAQHADAYRAWLGEMQGKRVVYRDTVSGERKSIVIPSAWDNWRFFLRYQVNFMYWRYFLWNFVGRQDDVPADGGPEHGNWLTGIPCVDMWRLGEHGTPSDTAYPEKGRNVFYAMPLLLGLLGMGWQIRKGDKGRSQFNVVLWLFFMTGLAIVLYLNQKPMEPRERDYAYAGSFYAFSIWIGMGAAALAGLLQRWRRTPSVAVIAVAISLSVPLQMIGQTWDDHDRSGRYVCRDFGQNYLNSLQKEGCPVIFVNGDNETFPLWYNTEVEGVRPDVRVCNLMYLTGGWYVDQMRRPSRLSPGLPVSIPWEYCRDGVNDAVQVNPVVRYTEEGIPVRLKEEVERIYREHPGEYPVGEDPWEWNNIVRYWLTSDDEEMRCIPTDEIHIRIDREAVKRSGMTIPDGVEIPECMTVSLKDRGYLLRTGIILLDLIQQCNWERPLYVATTMRIGEYLDISDYLVMEGMASRIVPFNARQAGAETDVETMYENVMSGFRFGGLENPSVWLDHQNRNMASILQHYMVGLAVDLCQQGQTDKAGRLAGKYLKYMCHPQLLKGKEHYARYMGELYVDAEQASEKE